MSKENNKLVLTVNGAPVEVALLFDKPLEFEHHQYGKSYVFKMKVINNTQGAKKGDEKVLFVNEKSPILNDLLTLKKGENFYIQKSQPAGESHTRFEITHTTTRPTPVQESVAATGDFDAIEALVTATKGASKTVDRVLSEVKDGDKLPLDEVFAVAMGKLYDLLKERG